MRQNYLAFSLVELSIVLVILGLLVGGVLSGQSLIHAAELRAVSSEYQKYTTAVASFRDKYFAIPGDMTNATAFWGKDNVACPAQPGAATVGGTCNGDGDGLIAISAYTGGYEKFQFWQHLSMAGLVEGKYGGVFGSGPTGYAAGVSVPASKFPSATWSVYSDPYTPMTTDNVNTYVFSALNPTYYPGYEANDFPVLKPEDAWNIDTKLDDGMPNTGFIGGINGDFTSATPCATGTTSADTYALGSSDVRCILNIIHI